VDFLPSRLKDRTPDEVSVLYNSASPDEQVLLETVSQATGRISMKMLDGGLEWRPLLDPDMVNENVMARAIARNPEAATKYQELQEMRSMHLSARTKSSQPGRTEARFA
jgi:hypothetical protein